MWETCADPLAAEMSARLALMPRAIARSRYPAGSVECEEHPSEACTNVKKLANGDLRFWVTPLSQITTRKSPILPGCDLELPAGKKQARGAQPRVPPERCGFAAGVGGVTPRTAGALTSGALGVVAPRNPAPTPLLTETG